MRRGNIIGLSRMSLYNNKMVQYSANDLITIHEKVKKKDIPGYRVSNH